MIRFVWPTKKKENDCLKGCESEKPSRKLVNNPCQGRRNTIFKPPIRFSSFPTRRTFLWLLISIAFESSYGLVMISLVQSEPLRPAPIIIVFFFLFKFRFNFSFMTEFSYSFFFSRREKFRAAIFASCHETFHESPSVPTSLVTLPLFDNFTESIFSSDLWFDYSCSNRIL